MLKLTAGGGFVAEMDQGIKRLLQTHPADVLAFAVPGAEYLGTMPVDIATEPQIVLDTLLRVRYQGVECAVDLEAEARPQRDIGRRCFEYGSRASVVTGMPIISVVLWLEANGTPPVSPYTLWAGDRLLATWHYIGIELYKLRSADLFTTGLVGLLPLVPFTRDGGSMSVIERAAEIVKQRAQAAEVSELAGLLAVFAGRRFEDEAILAMMRRLFMSTEIVEKSSVYQAWMARAWRDAVTLVLGGRFGELPFDLTQAIATADREHLQDVLAHAATDTLDELRARLGPTP